jgi:Tfp pilus assembly protein PilP
MKKINLLLLFISLLTFSSCKNEIKEDLENYVNVELPKIGAQETAVLSAYGSVTGENYQTDQITYEKLVSEIIPAYQKFITELEAISQKLNTKEIKDLNEKYIKAHQLQLSGMSLTVSALENQDMKTVTEANEKLNDGRKAIREFQDALTKVAKENNVEIKK